ncbi:MAG TPA: 30S ribosome-binding factor RbfA [Synergistales bacterium]|nr:30S ribosome-binding factor RbfA [Synergistaceae bacterium]HPE64578.1 30S ribosome-binding factor RbfA [Synergistales bacterium]HRV98055.1 30S ribosome-binding factor RbfA [Aminobacteriaceae bacterium]
MTTFRMQRINKQIQREVSLLLELRIKNETAKKAIITDVDCSRDLEHAKVYFTTVDRSEREEVGKALGTVAGALRSQLGKLLTIRQIPALSFFFDTSEEYGRSIDVLLDSLKTEDSVIERDEDDETEDASDTDELPEA